MGAVDVLAPELSLELLARPWRGIHSVRVALPSSIAGGRFTDIATMPYYAHSLKGDPDRSHWQPLAEHLVAVARLAEQFARVARSNNDAIAGLAYVTRLLH